VRLSTFWELMTAQFGETYARSVAKDHVFARLGDRTAEQALADGIDAQLVWRAVCEAYEVPERLRLTAEGCLWRAMISGQSRAVAWPCRKMSEVARSVFL